MEAFKAFNSKLEATRGKGVFRFVPGQTYREESSKTARTGFHCAEYPLDCLDYYGLEENPRFFLVEASGDINEDDHDSRIACTEIRLVRELTVRQMAGYAMQYMVKHPLRDWSKRGGMIAVLPDEASMDHQGGIAIARGKVPKVKGAEGAILGLIVEPVPGQITGAKLMTAGVDVKADTWYTLEDRTPKEVVV